jgi:hypothetical protein
MSRSTYIYTVQYGADIVATFTVKRELTLWLMSRKVKGWMPNMRVLRFSDGQGMQVGTPMDDAFWKQFDR